MAAVHAKIREHVPPHTGDRVLADDIEALADLRRAAYSQGGSLATMTELYIPFDPLAPAFINDPRDVDIIINRDNGQGALDQWVADHGGSIEDYNFYTFATRYVYRYVGYRKSDGANLGFLEVQPR